MNSKFYDNLNVSLSGNLFDALIEYTIITVIIKKLILHMLKSSTFLYYLLICKTKFTC